MQAVLDGVLSVVHLKWDLLRRSRSKSGKGLGRRVVNIRLSAIEDAKDVHPSIVPAKCV